MSSLTLDEPRNRFIETQVVSKLPMILRTPSSTSRMASGGIFKDRISFRLSFLMPPTACFAASSTGWMPRNSSSTCAFCFVISISSLPSLDCKCSTSRRFSTVPSMDFWIISIAWSASCCFCVSSARCSLAVFDMRATSFSASASLARPPLRCSTRSEIFLRCAT